MRIERERELITNERRGRDEDKIDIAASTPLLSSLLLCCPEGKWNLIFDRLVMRAGAPRAGPLAARGYVGNLGASKEPREDVRWGHLLGALILGPAKPIHRICTIHIGAKEDLIF